MTQEEIGNGIQLLCDTSSIVKSFYEDDQNIVNAINQSTQENLNKCNDYYKTISGVVVDIRKAIITRLLSNQEFTVESLQELINGFKKGKEKQYKSYQNTFSIVFPILTFYEHNPQRDFVKAFTKKIIEDLGIENEVKEVSYDFQGVRQQGSDRFWVAIYNKSQENQSTGLQLFFQFLDGKINYGIYKHENQSFLKPDISQTPEEFSYTEMLGYFGESKEDLLADVPIYENLSQLELGGHKLFKVSHGSFKAKKDEQKIEVFKQNNWIVLYEDTGKGQGNSFKNDLKKDDYVYITVGAKELIGIAIVSNEDWEYVPNDIVDSDGWIYREVEILQPAVRKKPKNLTSQKAIYPSANTTFFEIKPDQLQEANELLFKPYFNTEFLLNSRINENPREMDKDLNQILYGPPGTGKTFNTINKALKLCGDNLSGLDRGKIKELYKQRVDEGRIVFTTFHQSMTYEDFIEGIKPKSYNGKVLYNIEDGIFKQLCYKALFAHFNKSQSNLTSRFSEFDTLFDKYMEDVEQRLNALGSEEMLLLPLKSRGYYTEIKSLNEEERYFLTRGTRANSDAKVFKEKLRLLYNRFNSVEDIKDVSTDIRSVGPGLGWSSNYYGVFQDLKRFENEQFEKNNDAPSSKLDYPDYSQIREYVANNGFPDKYDPNADSFVIIIDEINRGNISQIFGELITLLEDDKRLGKNESLELILPYSKSSFGIPPNIYVLGTMNTADRSVEALDTALRRRFSFSEMPPDSELIKSYGKAENGIVNGFDLSELLKTINKRIEKLLDKDHMIGHSYFLSVDSIENLKKAFQNKVVPLLQEYFFGDYGKMGLVIGKGFFEIIENDEGEDFFAPMEDYETSALLEKRVYHLKNIGDMNDDEFIMALNQLLRK